MSFIPKGGFISIIIDDDFNKKNVEPFRNYPGNNNFISIKDIILKKKNDLFLDDISENSLNDFDSHFDKSPVKYKNIKQKSVSKKNLPRYIKNKNN